MTTYKIWSSDFISGFALGFDIQWRGTLEKPDDFGFDIFLGIIRVSYISCQDPTDYGWDCDADGYA